MDIKKVRAHLKDMLEARGDDVSYIEEHGDAIADERYVNSVVALTTDKTVVLFALSDAAVTALRKTVSQLTIDAMTKKCWWCDVSSTSKVQKDKGRSRFIVVLASQPTSQTLRLFDQYSSVLQVFYTKELTYNPLRHELVPKHRILSDKEKQAIMEEYRIEKPRHMPLIDNSDVICRWLGVRPGDVVEITRHNDSSGAYLYYRYCV